MSSSEIFQKALQLSAKERADLVHQLLLSLDADAQDADYEAAWRDELNRRLDAVESGSCDLVDGDDALNEIRRELDERKHQ
jgi:putative addiction module component (TIGR02574 family)